MERQQGEGGREEGCVCMSAGAEMKKEKKKK